MKTFNVELGLDILEQVLLHPETHNQSSWGAETSCGTTACVAGWAVIKSPESGYRVIPNPQLGGILRLQNRNGVKESFGRAGAQLLGLKQDGKRKFALFFDASDSQAIELLKYFIAHPKGDDLPPDWS